jgi:hypothetical protein
MRALTLFAVLMVLAGCAQQVQSTVTVFHALPAKGDGATIGIFAGNQANAGTLEFRSYAEKLAHYLQAAGYTVVDNPAATHPRFVAVFNYGIDDGTLVTETYAIPRFGVTGYSGSTTTGTISTYGGMSTLNATTTNVPRYGITGYNTDTTTERVFNRAIVLQIFDSTKFNPNVKDGAKEAQVYEGKLSSAGSCGSMAGVMDPLLEALFKDFPGESGKAHTVSVGMQGKC